MPSFLPEPGEFWMLSGVVLLVLEVALPGVFLMWLGIAALGTGLLTLGFSLAFWAQVVAFGVLAAISVTVPLVLRRRHTAHDLNTPASGLVGRTAVALTFRGRDGRVRVGDSDWPARLAAGSEGAEPGWMMEVAGVEGLVLVVRKRPDGPGSM